MRMLIPLVLLDTVPGPGLVIGLGMGITFLGLFVIILLLRLMSFLVGVFEKKKAEKPVVKKTEAVPETVIPNRGEFVAAVSAALAEELGADISKIRIISIRKL